MGLWKIHLLDEQNPRSYGSPFGLHRQARLKTLEKHIETSRANWGSHRLIGVFTIRYALVIDPYLLRNQYQFE